MYAGTATCQANTQSLSGTVQIIDVLVTIMPRTQPPQKQRHDPLLAELDGDEQYAKYGRVSQPGRRRKSHRHSAEDDTDEVLHPQSFCHYV